MTGHVGQRIGGLVTASRLGPTAMTAPMRQAASKSLDARLLADIDPDGQLDEASRKARLLLARRAYFTRLGLASAKARRAKAGAK